MSDYRIPEVIIAATRHAPQRLMSVFGHHGAVWRRATVLVVLCAVLVAISHSEDMHDALLQLFGAVDEVIDRHPVPGALSFVALAAVSAMVTFVSIAIVVPAAVFAWGEPASLLLLWAGWTLGGVSTYAMGRFVGRPIVRWLTRGRDPPRLEVLLERKASFWMVLLVQLAVPSEITGYVLGFGRYAFARYLLALGLAELPYSIATVHLGGSFLRNHTGWMLATALSIGALAIGAFCALRRVTRLADGPRDSAESTATCHNRFR